MPRLPRLAVGPVEPIGNCHPPVDLRPVTWGLTAALSQIGLQVQSFHSRACFASWDGALAITGSPGRHLDSWLMSPEVCRALFVHGAKSSDLALVDGSLAEAVGPNEQCPEAAGGLETLLDWLDLPMLVVVDAAGVERCRLPERRQRVDGVIVDRTTNLDQFYRVQTTIEALWGVPVFGSMPTLPRARRRLQKLPRGAAPPEELCHELGRRFRENSRLDLLRELAGRRAFPRGDYDLREVDGKLRVAVAFDDAFNCYFPDTLDLLELCGAQLVTFSPLRDDALPRDVDLVYLGCGHPERHADALRDNHCMSMAIHQYVRRGGRIYAEGGGLAYLCRHIQLPGGERLAMVGALSAEAHLSAAPRLPTPVEVATREDTWLGRAGTTLRGYLNNNWKLVPQGESSRSLGEAGGETVLAGSGRVLGSRVHLDFAAKPRRLRRFFRPIATACSAEPSGNPWRRA